MEKITIADFDLFCDIMKSLGKITTGAKVTIDSSGVTIYTKNSFARAVMTTNALTTDNPISICFSDLSTLNRLLTTIKSVHRNDYSNVDFNFDGQYLNFKSKKFKTKFITDREDVIAALIDQPIKAVLTPVMEFMTSSDLIKDVNGNSFIFANTEMARIYLNIHDDMEKNAIYANIANKENPLNNSMTVKLGLITMGKLDKELIIDFPRLNLFNVIQSDEIKIQLMDLNVLVSTVSKVGKNDTFLTIKVYNSLRGK